MGTASYGFAATDESTPADRARGGYAAWAGSASSERVKRPLERPASAFAEYFEPYTAEPLGSLEQSWTAAVALDWLAVPGRIRRRCAI